MGLLIMLLLIGVCLICALYFILKVIVLYKNSPENKEELRSNLVGFFVSLIIAAFFTICLYG